MSADSPRRPGGGLGGGPGPRGAGGGAGGRPGTPGSGQLVIPQPVNDRSIIDSVAGFINEVVPQVRTTRLALNYLITSKVPQVAPNVSPPAL